MCLHVWDKVKQHLPKGYSSFGTTFQHNFDIIKRFGRFPGRNEVLGRKSTKPEAAFLRQNQKQQHNGGGGGGGGKGVGKGVKRAARPQPPQGKLQKNAAKHRQHGASPSKPSPSKPSKKQDQPRRQQSKTFNSLKPQV